MSSIFFNSGQETHPLSHHNHESQVHKDLAIHGAMGSIHGHLKILEEKKLAIIIPSIQTTLEGILVVISQVSAPPTAFFCPFLYQRGTTMPI